MEAHCYVEYNRMERQHWWFQARRTVLGSVLARLARKLNRRPRILDLGCGTGESVRHLSQWGTVTAIDFSELALAYCQRKTLPRLIQADAARLPLADNSFDLVCGFDILEHLHDEAAALAEMKRVCKPGGQILLTVPALPILWSQHDVANHHQRRYRKGQLRDAVRHCGLEPEMITFFNTFLFPPTLAVRLVDRLVHGPKTAADAQMDLACTTGGRLSFLLRWIFAMEAPLVGRLPLPVGVSLLCLARNVGQPVPATEPATLDLNQWARRILQKFVRPPRPVSHPARPAMTRQYGPVSNTTVSFDSEEETPPSKTEPVLSETLREEILF